MKAKPAENPEIVCSVCGAATARAVERPQVLGQGAHLIVVERVPMYSCRNCGGDLLHRSRRAGIG